MRLVDADKLEYTCNSDECGMLTGCNHCQYHIITEDELDNTPTVEVIPKSDYENRLKADLVAMLAEIQLEIEELDPSGNEWSDSLDACNEVIQQKINSLKED